jgi:ABC-type sugar transport system substrate-binding protein
MTTRMVSIGIAALAVASLAACSSAGSNASNSSSADSASGKSITFIAGNKANGFYINMSCGIQAAAKAKNVKVDLTGPTQFSPTAQLPVIQAVAAKRPDALIIGPTDSTALTPTLKQLQSAGTKIVIVDQDVADTSVGVSRITSDNEAGGRQAADAMAKLINNTGKVLVLDIAPGAQASGLRAKGFISEMAAKYPNVKIVGTQYGQDDPTKAAGLVSAALSADPDLAGVFADDNQGALGAVTAIRTAGKTGKVKLVGFDGDPAEVAALKAGSIDALVTQEPYQIGSQAVTHALAALNGKTPPARTNTKTTVVTPQNVNDPAVSKFFYTSKCS